MQLKYLFFLIGLFLFPFSAFAQPAEYDKLFSLFQEPEELVKAEFAVAGSSSVFSVEVKSEKSVSELIRLFLEGAGLKTVSAIFTPPTKWELVLTNAETEALAVEKFDEIKDLPWKNKPSSFPSYGVYNKRIVATTFPANSDELAYNLELAGSADMEFSGSEPSPESSSAIFSLYFNKPTVTATVNQEVDELSAEINKIAKIIEQQSHQGSREYKLDASLEQVSRLLELPWRFKRSLKFVSLNCLDHKQAHVTMRVSDQKSPSTQKLAILKKLVQENPIEWAKTGNVGDVPVLTGFETSFGDKITLTGLSPKSSLIFSHFFSMIERCEGLKNPFFSRGTYQANGENKVLQFRIDCDW